MIPNYQIGLLLTIYFFLAGIDKIPNFTNVVQGFINIISNKLAISLPKILGQISIIMAIIIEIGAPVMIVYYLYKKDQTYKRYALLSIQALLIFLIFATYLYHSPPYGEQWYKFMSNLTIFGGLLLLYKCIKKNQYQL